MGGCGSRATELAEGETNAVGRMLGQLGDEWSLLVLQQALLGVRRYGDFVAALGVSHSVLTRRLRTLTSDGLLERRAYQQSPPRWEYLVTPRSRSLWPVLLSIWAWERRWVPDHVLPAMRHDACSQDFAPVLTCRTCDEPVHERRIAARWGPSGCWPRSMPTAPNRRRPAVGREAGQFGQIMAVLGNGWSFSMVVCAFMGATRFGQFQTQLGAPPGSVADRLQILCAHGVLDASAGRAGGPTYRLTAKGRALLPVLILAVQWAQNWFVAPEGPAVVLTHTCCERPLSAALTCDRCGRSLTGTQVLMV